MILFRPFSFDTGIIGISYQWLLQEEIKRFARKKKDEIRIRNQDDQDRSL